MWAPLHSNWKKGEVDQSKTFKERGGGVKSPEILGTNLNTVVGAIEAPGLAWLKSASIRLSGHMVLRKEVRLDGGPC